MRASGTATTVLGCSTSGIQKRSREPRVAVSAPDLDAATPNPGAADSEYFGGQRRGLDDPNCLRESRGPISQIDGDLGSPVGALLERQKDKREVHAHPLPPDCLFLAPKVNWFDWPEAMLG